MAQDAIVGKCAIRQVSQSRAGEPLAPPAIFPAIFSRVILQEYAGGALQAALTGSLVREARLTGIYDGPPARAAFPYAVVDAGNESDWSHKSGEGREVLVALTIWDEEPARLAELADAVEGLAVGTSLVGGWHLVSMQLIRRRTVRDVAGPWATAIDFRARLLAV